MVSYTQVQREIERLRDGCGCDAGVRVTPMCSDCRRIVQMLETLLATQSYISERLEELREWRREEPRGYTRRAYDAQIEELERLQEEMGWE